MNDIVSITPEEAILKIWQKNPNTKIDHYFEFIPNEDFTTVDILVCEQYKNSKLKEMYYGYQPEYSSLDKSKIKINNEIKFKIIQYFENNKIRMLWR
jgi:hypothetical protein